MVKDKDGDSINLFRLYEDPKKDFVQRYTYDAPAVVAVNGGTSDIPNYFAGFVCEAPEHIKVRAMEIRKRCASLLSTETI